MAVVSNVSILSKVSIVNNVWFSNERKKTYFDQSGKETANILYSTSDAVQHSVFDGSGISDSGVLMSDEMKSALGLELGFPRLHSLTQSQSTRYRRGHLENHRHLESYVFTQTTIKHTTGKEVRRWLAGLQHELLAAAAELRLVVRPDGVRCFAPHSV